MESILKLTILCVDFHLAMDVITEQCVQNDKTAHLKCSSYLYYIVTHQCSQSSKTRMQHSQRGPMYEQIVAAVDQLHSDAAAHSDLGDYAARPRDIFAQANTIVGVPVFFSVYYARHSCKTSTYKYALRPIYRQDPSGSAPIRDTIKCFTDLWRVKQADSRCFTTVARPVAPVS